MNAARRWIATALVGLVAAGCSAEVPTDLSPSADQDPARYERAEGQARAYLEKARAAERKALKGRAKGLAGDF